MEWKISGKTAVIVIALIILSAFLFVRFNPEMFHPPHPGMGITKYNEPGTPPLGMIHHVSDEDFIRFPFLAPVIRDNSLTGTSDKNGTRIVYAVGLSWEEYNRFMGSNFSRYQSNHTTGEDETYFEYRGTFYSYSPPWIP